MTTNLTRGDRALLDTLAELLLLAGADRAADTIYAAIGAEAPADWAPGSTIDGQVDCEWQEAFGN
ncbi:hypothetical protein [Novosphingobium sp. M1R2S20]|uniref:Uncharacterized protein n=1 Tax=Novosphingobium rhizovicinum TaxID=3228928 RepID=A0ABV3RCX3_9SPHN